MYLLILAAWSSTSYNRLPEEQTICYVTEVTTDKKVLYVDLKEKLNQK